MIRLLRQRRQEVPAHRAAAQPVAAEPQLVQRAALAQQVPVRRAERRRDVEAVLQAGLRLELLSAGLAVAAAAHLSSSLGTTQQHSAR